MIKDVVLVTKEYPLLKIKDKKVLRIKDKRFAVCKFDDGELRMSVTEAIDLLGISNDNMKESTELIESFGQIDGMTYRDAADNLHVFYNLRGLVKVAIYSGGNIYKKIDLVFSAMSMGNKAIEQNSVTDEK